MKRTAVVIAASVLTLGLVAPAHAAPSKIDIDELLFLATMQTHTDALALAPEDDLLKLGRVTCKVFIAGKSINRLVHDYEDTGIPRLEVGVLIGAAANNLCPSQRKKVQRYILSHY
jgi:hypothetical protein